MSNFEHMLERVRRRLEFILHEENDAPVFSIETILLLLSKFYGGATALRTRWYQKGILVSETLPCKVISIGNLVTGGTGKTPMTIRVAQSIRDMGYRVVVISRGYGGKLEKKGGIVSDGENILRNSTDAGDEPYLMAKCLNGVPVVVGSRRYEAGLLAVKHFKPDVIVLDDAFQHLRLHRDLNIVLLDCRRPFGNGNILPRGTLREPLSALNRADVVSVTRSRGRHLSPRIERIPASLPTFYTEHKLVMRKFNREKEAFTKRKEDIAQLKGKKAFAFAGLANNDQFFSSLREIGCELIQTVSFPDHHRYGVTDLDKIAETARLFDMDFLITTLKDAVKIDMEYPWPFALVVLDIEIHFVGGMRPFLSIVDDTIKKN